MGVQIKAPAALPGYPSPKSAAVAAPVPVPPAATPKKVFSPGVAQSIAPPAPVIKNALSSVVSKIQKESGEKSIVYARMIPNCRRLPTGIFEFDLATGGGFPRGRYSILFGPESSCKTNIVYKAIASAQRLPPPCNKAVLVDLEGTFDPAFAALFGVDLDELIVVKPSYGEQAVDMIDALIRADDVAFLAVDSIAVLIAAKELEGSVEKADVGTSALLIKRLANKVAVALSEEGKIGHDPALVFINQTRFKIGVMFGNPETMPGGQTIKFNSSLTIRVSGKNLTEKAISSEVHAFKEVSATIRKSKVGVVQNAFDFNMCMMEHDGMFVGDTDSFGAVKGYLQSLGHLTKNAKNGWDLLGKNYSTLKIIEDTYRGEDSFALELQSLVIKSQSLKMVQTMNDDEVPPNGVPKQVP